MWHLNMQIASDSFEDFWGWNLRLVEIISKIFFSIEMGV